MPGGSISTVRHLFRHISPMNKGQIIRYDVQDNVAVITFDDPTQKMNTLSQDASRELEAAFQRFQGDASADSAVLISGKKDCFIAGADIGMLQATQSVEELSDLSRNGQRMLEKIEKSHKPVVAAIMGPCLGGGLEVALACHYRIALKDKKTVLGLPEVMLGLLPGAGGTQRLPKLVGLPTSLDMMLTGKNIRPDKAKKMKLVDVAVDPVGPGITDAQTRTADYFKEVAIARAKDLAAIRAARSKTFMQNLMSNWSINPMKYIVFNMARSGVMKKTHGVYPAPLKILDVVEAGLKDASSGYEAEAKAFGELGFSSESRALIGLYNGRTHCKKNHYGKPEKPVQNLAILGAGLMGAGIAQVSIDKGIKTTLKDMAAPGLQRGRHQVESGLQLAVKKKKLSKSEADRYLHNLKTTLTYDGFKQQDMIIEAVFEDIDIKHRVVKEVEQEISTDCVFASNTSALPISDIAKASARPDKMIGMHYFSPVDKMELLEIITTEQTSKETLSRAVDVGLRQGKQIIVVKDGPGFYTTRALAAYMSEVFKVLLEGVSPKELDDLTKRIGFPVGSATLVDEVGVDVAYHVGEFTGRTFGARFGFSSNDTELLKMMMDKGFMGRKSGRGLYNYSTEKGKGRSMNSEALQLLKQHAINSPVTLSNDVLRMRLLSRFVNEAVLIHQETILNNPLEGDIGAVFGLGFPPQLGGPFRFVDLYGADKIVKQMREFENIYGERFTPCQLLIDHANDSSKRFHRK